MDGGTTTQEKERVRKGIRNVSYSNYLNLRIPNKEIHEIWGKNKFATEF